MTDMITLSQETSDLLRKVAAIDGFQEDFLVRMWCVAALPIKDAGYFGDGDD
jgi:hypothetical protein